MSPSPPNHVENGCGAAKDKKFSRIYPETDGDDIVITGMSGKFPKSRNIAEYEYNLYNKVDMMDEEETRWKHFSPEIPKRSGKLYDLEKFDATFFGVHFKQAQSLDPQLRILMEAAYEAVLDAGVNPKTLKGSRTGVYIGSCFSESEKNWFYERISTGGFGITGCSRAMLANRISYALGLNGPSYLVDTACSSSMYALENAFTAFRNGEIDAAIVGGSNLTLHPYVTLQFARLGVLASDGYCRPFDANASGYTRSEAVNCLFLQKKRDAKRIYASVVFSKTNCDGFKTEGITFPSGLMQEKLLQEFYNTVDISPDDLGYLEAHSTGTVVGDPEECKAIDNAICKARKSPLLVGSVKSNIGHSEAASGTCSLIKALLTFQNGKIPPNIHFTSIRKEIPCLVEGRLKVVTEVEELEKPYIGVNSFGFGGANAHALLKGCSKVKTNNGIPNDDLPRLVNWSGRVNEGVQSVFDAIQSRPLDAEFIALLQSIQKDNIPGLVFRGYGLFSKDPNGGNAKCIQQNIQHHSGIKRPIVWVFSGMGSQWTEMGASLMVIPLFRESIQKCHRVLAKEGINLIEILTSPDTKTYDNILHSFVGIAAVQIAIVDVLRALDLHPDYLIGHSVGELGCGYADGGFNAEQMILASYSRGKASLEIDKIHGSMAAIGLGYKNIREMLPSEIEVACHNSPNSVTISGPAENVGKFVEELKSKGIFAKEVPCSNIAYHSRYIAHMGPLLFKYLKKIIPEPKQRSSKWISTSVPQNRWEETESQYCSAKYHTNNLLSSVLFEEGSQLLPPNCLTIEIAPHGLLQGILKNCLPEGVHVPLTQRGNKNNAEYFLSSLGKLYSHGIDFAIEKLYPPIEWPVSQGTPSISPLIKWDHSEDWFVMKFENIIGTRTGERKFDISLVSDNEEYMKGHRIDGRILIPATAYLQCVWDTFCRMKRGPMFMDMAVEFEDVRFIRATPLNKEDNIKLICVIHYETGSFEITESDQIVVTGKITEIKNPQPPASIDIEASNLPMLERKDFYKELRLRGYEYSDEFRSVKEARADGLYGKVKWSLNWVTFMDCLLQIGILQSDSRSLRLPTRIRKLRINGKYHLKLLNNLEPENDQTLEAYGCPHSERIVCGGIEVIGLHTSSVSRRKPPGITVLENYQFIPLLPTPVVSQNDAAKIFTQLFLEINPIIKLKIIEIDGEHQIENKDKPPFLMNIITAFEDLPLVTGRFMLLSKRDLNLNGVEILNRKLDSQSKCSIVIGEKLSSNQDNHGKLRKSLMNKGFIISRESKSLLANDFQIPSGFNLLSIILTEEENLFICVKSKDIPVTTTVPEVVKISTSDSNFEWVETLKQNLKEKQVILLSQNEKCNGLLGLANCLNKELEPGQVTAVLIDDPKAPPFDLNLPLYKDQLSLELPINVYKNGKWGTYRHLEIKKSLDLLSYKEHVFANIEQSGDFSTMGWYRGPNCSTGEQTRVVYASLNFRDVMLASGRLDSDIFKTKRNEFNCLFGLEFSGINHNGEAIMGMIDKGAVSSHVSSNDHLVFKVPKSWTLEEAATVPVVYITVYYAFFFHTNIKKGKSILIHSGTGGIGLAAIQIALAYGLEVFTTVGTAEKKAYLIKSFPQIEESHIGNSRDTSFEDMIVKQTKGKGVDFVLNSLAEDKLLASIRCLGKGGHFLEIGKFDMASDNKVGLGCFLKELSFHAVLADNLFNASYKLVNDLKTMIEKDIAAGIIKPLPTTIFEANEIEKAFRYMSTGKHIGKVLLKIRENPRSEYTMKIIAKPQVFFSSDKVYIIPGGLGGFGLELADWMILRGARKIILSSSRGITQSYQTYRIAIWGTYGIKVIVNTDNITTREGCEALIKTGLKLGPIGGVFNLAVALRDAMFYNQSSQLFLESMTPKALATKYLDELTRKHCTDLDHFVIFSSVSCGRGNAGQTNYGMANSIMERIIEERKKENLPGKAIQWGAIGDVGLVAAMAEDKHDLEIGGTLQQRISSCLHKLDVLLSCPDPIVSSMVVAEKQIGKHEKLNLIQTIMKCMNIRDLKSISMETSLSEMGLDSLMAVEIKQILERDFELFFSQQDLRVLTFRKLEELSKSKDVGENDQPTMGVHILNSQNKTGLALLVGSLGDEANSECVLLSVNPGNPSKTIKNFFIPGIEGVPSESLINVAKNLDSFAGILQLLETKDMMNINDIVNFLLPYTKQVLTSSKTFHLIGHSFGAVITLKLAKLLETLGYVGKVSLIDGAPVFLLALISPFQNENVTEEDISSHIFSELTSRALPDACIDDIYEMYSNEKGADFKLAKLVELCGQQKIYSKDYILKLAQGVYNRIKMLINMNLSEFEQINSPILLVRPKDPVVVNINEDYDLRKLTKGEFSLKFIEGNHVSILDNPELIKILRENE